MTKWLRTPLKLVRSRTVMGPTYAHGVMPFYDFCRQTKLFRKCQVILSYHLSDVVCSPFSFQRNCKLSRMSHPPLFLVLSETRSGKLRMISGLPSSLGGSSWLYFPSAESFFLHLINVASSFITFHVLLFSLYCFYRVVS